MAYSRKSITFAFTNHNTPLMAKKQLQEIKHLWELNSVWNALTEEEKAYAEKNAKTYVFRKNELIYREGDAPTHMMMLVSGKLRVHKEGVSNRNQIIRMLKPYDLFGYRAIIADERYNTSVSAVEQSEVYLIHRDAFMKLIQENSKFCYMVLLDMAKDLGNSDTRTVNIAQKHIRGRLAESLLYLKDNYGLDEDQATISVYMSREDLANLSNMTTSNAIRTLSNFAAEGILSVDGKKIKILDMDELVRTSRLG